MPGNFASYGSAPQTTTPPIRSIMGIGPTTTSKHELPESAVNHPAITASPRPSSLVSHRVEAHLPLCAPILDGKTKYTVLPHHPVQGADRASLTVEPLSPNMLWHYTSSSHSAFTVPLNEAPCARTVTVPSAQLHTIYIPYSPIIYFIPSQTDHHLASPFVIATTIKPSPPSISRLDQLHHPQPQEHRVHSTPTVTTPLKMPSPTQPPSPITKMARNQYGTSVSTVVLLSTGFLAGQSVGQAFTLAWERFTLAWERLIDIYLVVASLFVLFMVAARFLPMPAISEEDMEQWLMICRPYFHLILDLLMSNILALMGGRFVMYTMYITRKFISATVETREATTLAMSTWPVITGFYQGYPWAFFLAALACTTMDIWWRPAITLLRRNIVEPCHQLCTAIALVWSLGQVYVKRNFHRALSAVCEYTQVKWVSLCRCMGIAWNFLCHHGRAIPGLCRAGMLSIGRAIQRSCRAIQRFSRACVLIAGRAVQGSYRAIQRFSRACVLFAQNDLPYVFRIAWAFLLAIPGNARAGWHALPVLPVWLQQSVMGKLVLLLADQFVASNQLFTARVMFGVMLWIALIYVIHRGHSSTCVVVCFGMVCLSSIMLCR